MSERSGQTAKGKDGKSKYASLNLFDTYKGKSLEAQKPVVPPRHGLQSLGKVASARRMPPPASLPSLKAENKGNDPNVSLVPKDGTGWASKLEPADPKSTDVLSAAQLELPQPVVSQTPVPTRPRTPPAPEASPPVPAPVSAQAAGAKSWAPASVTHGAQGDGGKGSNQPSPFSREEFPTLQAAGDQDKAGREQGTADQWYGPGPSLRPPNMTSWRDGGGRALAPTGEGVAEGGPGGALVMEGAAVGGQAGPPLQQQQNPQSHGPPRNPPAGSPVLPQPPVGPGFPQYRGIMPPFMYPPYLPFPPPYGPQGPYGYPPPGEAPPRFRQQGQDSRGRPQGVPRGGGGEMVKRPSILKQDDLKELDELDHQDGDEGWAGAHEEIDYSAKLKFSDDEGEEEGDEERNERPERSERSESKNGPREIQRSQEGPLHVAQRSRASDSGGDRDTSRTPPSNADHDGPPPPSCKPGWAEEGCNSGPATYQGRRPGLGGHWEQPSPPPGPLLHQGQGPYSYYRQDRNSPNQSGPVVAPGTVSASLAPGKPTPSPQLQQQQATSPVPGGPTPPPQTAGLLAPPPGEDEDETWRQRRKQSSSEISAAVERARRRREEEERRMEEERRAACAEKLKRLDEKAQQQGGGGGSSGGSKPPSLDGSSATAGSPSPSLSASASSPNISQPPSPCVDHDEPPLAAQAVTRDLVPGPSHTDRQRANSNSSYDSNTDTQMCPQPPTPLLQQPPLEVLVPGEGKEEILGSAHVRGGGVVDPMKVEGMAGGAGRQASAPPGQGYSKYQKSLPPRFQRQQQEQLMKQQQQWQQQHSQAGQQSQQQLQPQQAPQQQGPSLGATPQTQGPKQQQSGPLQYTPQGSMGRGPLPMNFDPRWMMMPYMDPRMMQGGMQGRPPGPMDYYPPNMQHAGMMGRERSDSGGSGSDNFDRQQHPGHPHSGTPPIDTKLAWGPEVFPGGSEGRGLSSPLRQKQALEEDDVSGKGTRSDTPPVRGMREGGPGPIQQPGSGSSNQTPAPVGTQVVGHGGGSHHHQSYMGGRGNYINFPDQGSRMAPHQQQQQRGSDGGFSHQDEGQGHKGGQQQGQIWGGPRPQYDRNGRTDLSLLENNNPHHPQHHGHQQHQAPSHFPLHLHKPENGRSERGGEAPKKGDPSTPLQQPSLSSCSSSSSSSSAREDGSGKVVLHHFPPQREADTGTGQRNEAGSGREMKQDKMGPGHSHSQSSVTSQQSHPQSQQQRQGQEQQHHRDPKPNQRERGGREHKTETQWGPRPGSSNAGGPSSHNRRAVGGNSRGGEDSSNHPTASDHNKPAGGQSGGGNTNKRAGPIKRPVLKREGGEGEGGEKTSGGGFGKDERQDGGHSSVKQEASSGPQSSSAVSGKEEPAQTGPKPRNGGKDRAVNERGGVGKGPKNGVNPTPSSGYSGPPSNRRDRERSFERGGGASYHGVSARGSRVSRGRGGEFYGRGRGYRGTYTGMAGGGSVGRGRAASSRSSRDYRSGGGYDEASGGRRGRGGSQANPGRARNHSETRSEGSEYEEVPKRRRQRGSETGSESAASDLAQSDKEDRKSSTKNGSGTYNVTGSGSAPPRGSQARVFTPRGVPSRRGRGGGGGGGGIYRSGGGGMAGGHRSGSRADPHGWASKSSASVRKQQAPMQSAAPKDTGRGTSGEKEKAADGSRAQNQGGATPPQSIPAAPTSAPQGSMENGGVGIQQSTANPTTNSSGPLPLPLSGPDGRDFPRVPRDGFERPPRRRRHGRSQHQQDKPPRFRRLKERENAARINGGVGVIGGGRPSSPGQNYVQDVTDGAPNAAPTTGGAPNANPNVTTATNNSTGGHLGSANANSHHHHHYNQGISGQAHSQHHHNPAGGAKSPDFSNQNSDQANEEWETASESSDFTEFREREGGGGKSYSSHHHHHPHGRGGGGGGVVGEREMKAKEQAANKRSFSSQRPGMERQNRRVNAGGREGREGGGGRGPRGPPGGGGAGNGGGQRGERRGNWPSPKNRK
ncbi:protein PRRC2A-like isoform X1 [Coregonus clupeaformis]|uniref:protein PRRC2A-like isoform X1 n=1 Tax=Coregonus clupeaformis TaxID=59861 RepID=UPI001E1C279E|nr:protein PRRC2A-like isoform X1 [Coregonus clupeaformis]XP_045082255.1 protein PRRC2A-like isoform X1 [Coregonus clupeaformis]